MCGCKKKHKRGSGVRFLSGATWKGYGPYKKGSGVRKKKRKGAGMSFRGQGVNFSGQGVNFSGQGVNFTGQGVYGKRVAYHRSSNGKRVL